MVYSTSKCPTCGQVLKRQTNPVHKIGSPFRRCPHCGNTYLDSYEEEWITKSPARRIFYFIQDGVWARALAIPFLIVALVLAVFDLSSDVFFPIWLVFALAWLIGGYFAHKKLEKKDIEASLERTKDPEYLELLKKAGYTIYPLPY